MIKGIIILNKPKGLTSHDCVAHLRRKTGIKKIGHTGTLDPQATGVLPMCIGNATRMIEYLEHDQKTYLCEITFGITTDTYDIWGTETPTTIQRGKALEQLNRENLLEELPAFRGEIIQTPPVYSAIRKNGKRLYEYARKGEEVEIPTRRVTIYQLEMTDFDKENLKAKLLITCSKGTYIRSICKDLGEALGCGAVMSSLERQSCGNMNIEDAVTLEEFEKSEDYQIYLKPMWYPLKGLGEIQGNLDNKNDLGDGKKIVIEKKQVVRKPSCEEQSHIYGILGSGELWAIGRLDGETFKPEKVFLKRESD
jgi:tRNA pseudouridine55 synthase